MAEMPVAGFENAGPAVRRIGELAVAAAAARGLDTAAAPYRLLDQYLQDLGCANVQRHEATLPIGEWGGRAGSLFATDFRIASVRILEARSTLTAEERTELVQRALVECEERHVTCGLAVAFGQRSS
jgi:hypothetical protein